MSNIIKISDAEVTQRLKTMNGWGLDQGKLYKVYKFKNFISAFAFMTQVAEIAEAVGHHPEWFNVYGTVRVHLTTHEAGGISQRDFDLACKMDDLL